MEEVSTPMRHGTLRQSPCHSVNPSRHLVCTARCTRETVGHREANVTKYAGQWLIRSPSHGDRVTCAGRASVCFRLWSLPLSVRGLTSAQRLRTESCGDAQAPATHPPTQQGALTLQTYRKMTRASISSTPRPQSSNTSITQRRGLTLGRD